MPFFQEMLHSEHNWTKPISMAGWNDFYIAVAGASAALTGLIFVGISISLTKILTIPGLADRALLSLILLVNVLVLSLLFLVPNLSVKTSGISVSVIAIFTWLIIFRLDIRNIRNKPTQHQRQYIFNMLIDQFATSCFILMGVTMALGCTNCEYLIVPAVFVSIVKAVFDGWVLLVEINR